MTTTLTRRQAIGTITVVGVLAIAGCGPSGGNEAAETQAPRQPAPATPVQAEAMTVYRDPGCGCCEAWAGLAREAGYQVTLIDHQDMPAIKRQYGVPAELLSCHTGIVDGYVIEGHVPFGDVARLVKERPTGIKGIAVAGMPRGSPGMEVPDGTKDPFQVLAFDAAGRITPFRA